MQASQNTCPQNVAVASITPSRQTTHLKSLKTLLVGASDAEGSVAICSLSLPIVASMPVDSCPSGKIDNCDCGACEEKAEVGALDCVWSKASMALPVGFAGTAAPSSPSPSLLVGSGVTSAVVLRRRRAVFLAATLLGRFDFAVIADVAVSVACVVAVEGARG